MINLGNAGFPALYLSYKGTNILSQILFYITLSLQYYVIEIFFNDFIRLMNS